MLRRQRRRQRCAGSDSDAVKTAGSGAGAVKTATLAALCGQRQRCCADSGAGSAVQSAAAAL
eukprot:4753730-Pleurochrysis_carterae.AAC.1